MKDQTEGSQFLRAYALGEFCSDTEADSESTASFEFDEQEFLLSTEDDLFDDYLSGELSEEDSIKFADCYLNNAAGREKLQFAAAFRRYRATSEGPRSQFSVNAITIRSNQTIPPSIRHRRALTLWAISACVVTGAVLAIGLMKPPRSEQLARDATPDHLAGDSSAGATVIKGGTFISNVSGQAAPVAAAHRRQVQTVPLPTESLYPKNVMVCFFPASMIDTKGSAKKISIPATAQRLHVQLGFSGDVNKAYSVQLQNGGGRNVFRQRGLMLEPLVSGTGITFSVPAKILPPGKYRLALEETTEDGNPERLGVYKMQVAVSEGRLF